MLLLYRGFDPGPVDGEMSKRTRSALRQFQEQVGIPASGNVDDAMVAALEAA